MSHQRFTFRNAAWEFPRGEMDTFFWTTDKDAAVNLGKTEGAVAVCTMELHPCGKWAVVLDESIEA